MMKRMIALMAISTAFGVAACDDPGSSNEPEYADTPVEAPVAPAAEDVGAPVADPAAGTRPVDTTTVPPAKRSSEESVQPESETLFY